MMALTNTLVPQAPPLRESNGVLLVEGTRVPLDTIIFEYSRGSTAEQIAEAYDTVKVADIYAILSYYLKNRERVDAYLVERQKQAESIRREIESQPGYQEFTDSLRERMKQYRESKQPK